LVPYVGIFPHKEIYSPHHTVRILDEILNSKKIILMLSPLYVILSWDKVT